METIKKESIIKASVIIIVILCMEKILGFGREVVQAYYYGTGSFIDSVVSASLVTNIFSGWMACFAVAFVPLYKKASMEGKGDVKAHKIYTLCVVFSLIACVLEIAFARGLVKLALPGFGEEQQKMTATILRWLSVVLLFKYSTQLKNARITCEGQYSKSVFSGLTINLVQIIFIFAFARINKYAIVWGIIFAYFVEYVVSVIILKQMEIKDKLCMPDRSTICEIGIIMLPVFLTSVIDDICSFVDRVFASYLPEGSVSSLSYGNSLMKFVNTFVITILTSVLYPYVSEFIAQKRYAETKAVINKCIYFLLIILVPIILTCISTSDAIVSIIFERGKFDVRSSEMTTGAFVAYIIGVIPYCIEAVIIKYFYADGKSRQCIFLVG